MTKLGNLREDIRETKAEIQNHINEIKKWLKKSDKEYEEDDCCTFRDETYKTLEDIVNLIGAGASDSEAIIKDGRDNGVDTGSAEAELKYLDETNTTLTEYLTRLNTICSPALCSGRGDYDCSAPEDCE